VCQNIPTWGAGGERPSIEDGNLCIAAMIHAGSPFLLFRTGGTELKHVMHFMSERPPPQWMLDDLWRMSGIFPSDVKVWREWMTTFANALMAATIYVDMFPLDWGVGVPIFHYHPDALRVQWGSLVSFWNGDLAGIPDHGLPDSWVTALEGKTVLYVGSFPVTVAKQFHRNDTRCPKFRELKIVGTVQAYGGHVPAGYEGRTSIDAINDITAAIDQQGEFDVALLSAGAYTAPLAHHVFKKGRIAIYFGGSLQNLFGIKGHRWLGWFKSHVAKYPEERAWWVGPDRSEIPERCTKAEDCAYFDKETMRMLGIVE
ncbi:MAG: hypothetical protein Q8P67_13755, partial [archaeon]|nr:hypothetical protein [archaeon]